MLTPNETIHAPGKTMFFDTDGMAPERKLLLNGDELAVTGDRVPWERPLKHALYLVLNNRVDEQWNGR